MDDTLLDNPQRSTNLTNDRGTLSTATDESNVTTSGSTLQHWKQQLLALRQRAEEAVQHLTDYLRGLRPSEAETAVSVEVARHLAESLESLSRRQDSLEEMLHENWNRGLEPASGIAPGNESEPPAWAWDFQAAMNERLAALETRLADAGREPPPVATNSEESPIEMEAFATTLDGDAPTWLRVMLGSELSDDPRMTTAIGWLEGNLVSGHEGALYLLGQLLVFRFAPTDRKPNLLKDVGEAFYRCFPKNTDAADPFEAALASWLRQHCEAAGLANSIEVVHPGERFDSTKHSPLERGGVEVARVLGWVVLRDGGRVYSKALVQTR